MAPGRPRVPGLRAQELTHSRSNRAPRAAGLARSRLCTAPPRAARTTREPESVLRGLAAAGVRGAGPRENGGASTGEAARRRSGGEQKVPNTGPQIDAHGFLLLHKKIRKIREKNYPPGRRPGCPSSLENCGDESILFKVFHHLLRVSYFDSQSFQDVTLIYSCCNLANEFFQRFQALKPKIQPRSCQTST
eukprot:XP_022274868.1 uncharacterized protein LOC102156567 isoform X2 [Canis lupus familiaris]